jgi:hypothetical protein
MKIQFLFFSLLMFFSECSSNDDLPCPPGVEKEDCICMSVYEPVCGCDQVTYSNSCVAACHDIDIAHEGVCK